MKTLAIAILLTLATPARADILDGVWQVNYDPNFDTAIRDQIDAGGATAAMTCTDATATLSLWVGWEMPIATATLVGNRILGPVPGLPGNPHTVLVGCQYSWRPNMLIAAAGYWWRVTISPKCPNGTLAGQNMVDVWQFGTSRFWSNLNGPFRARAWWRDKIQACGGNVDQYWNYGDQICVGRINPSTGQTFALCTAWANPGGIQ